MQRSLFGDKPKLDQHDVKPFRSCFRSPSSPGNCSGFHKVFPGQKVGRRSAQMQGHMVKCPHSEHFAKQAATIAGF